MSSRINQEIPVMVRILPMSSLEEWKGKPISKLQKDFFRGKLALTRRGKYHFRALGINAERGSIILFQYDSKIIGLAKLEGVKKRKDPSYFDIPTELDDDRDYKGAYYFEPYSIRTFTPISAEEIKKIWGKKFTDRNGVKHPAFEKFSEAKQFLDPEKYPDFCKLLEDVREPKIVKG